MADIIIPPETAVLNRLAWEVQEKLADLCRAVPFDRAGEAEVATFWRAQGEVCRAFFRDARP